MFEKLESYVINDDDINVGYSKSNAKTLQFFYLFIFISVFCIKSKENIDNKRSKVYTTHTCISGKFKLFFDTHTQNTRLSLSHTDFNIIKTILL